mmetsp:Transcript_40984/g.64642  ORF Transcript_40984/g.64642 Transcript_40984/m.64642 type:complete len:222 (+) Transcript_40984:677-1342(+)
MCLDVDKLPQRRVQGKSMHPVTFEGDDQLSGSPVHAVAGHHDVVARAQDVVHCCRARVLLLIDCKDGACTNVAVDIAAAIKGIECDHEAASLLLGHEDGILVFFRDKHCTCTAVGQGIDENLIGQHIQLFLVVTCGVHLPSQAKEHGDAGLVASSRGRLAGQLKRHQQNGQLLVSRLSHDVPVEGWECAHTHAVRGGGDGFILLGKNWGSTVASHGRALKR